MHYLFFYILVQLAPGCGNTIVSLQLRLWWLSAEAC